MTRKIQLVFVACLLFMACNQSNPKNEGPTVTVSIIPQKFFVNQIAGNWLNVNVMVPPGSSPATYEPTPMQMRLLSESSIYFRIGHIGFEKAWMEKLVSVNPALKFIDTSEGLDLIIEEEWDEGHEQNHKHDHHHEGFNPHIWLAPKLVKQQAEKMYDALVQIYPEHANEMKQNLNRFYEKCDSVEIELDSILKKHEGVSFIVYHPVWNYLARDYGLKQISIEHNGKEATANKLKGIVDFAKANNVKVIVAQKEFSDAQAKAIAREINGEVLILNPLDYDWVKVMKEFGEVFNAMKND